MLDSVIIGAGPAGITASIYAVRKRMDFVVVSRDIGGQTAWSGDIENYTGYQFITGVELTTKFEEHMRRYGIELKLNEEVTEVLKKDGLVRVRSDKGEYEARTAIIASGKRVRELGVPGEKEFKNRGLTYCATCDGPLFGKKDVAVIGGGNSGLEAVLQLIKIAGHIYLIEVGPGLRGDPVMQEKINKNDKITILTNTRVTAVLGDKIVTGVTVKKKDSETEETLSVQGVFVEIGLIPNSKFTQGVDKNQQGEIKVNNRNQTNIPGIFAAGDVTDVPEKQIIVSAGEGAKAALSAFRYLALQK